MLLCLLSAIASAHSVAAATTITAYKAQTPVKLDGVVESGEWTDTAQFVEKSSQMTVAFKQNGTGLLWLMQWTESSPSCTDSACFGGIELGFLNNTAEMGSPTTPTVMVLTSSSFKGNVDEFVSTGDQTPAPVETYGYSTQSVCGLKLVGQEYTAECYRPFVFHNPSPYDPFPTLVAGSPIEIGFAVGEFTSPGDHLASDMSTYVLTLSNQPYVPTSTTSGSTVESISSTSTSTGLSSTSSPPSSSSSTSTTSTTTTTSIVSSASSAVSSVSTAASTYAEELLVMAIGFSVLILVALAKYERS